MWDWGLRQIERLPAWAMWTFGVFLFWPCIVVPRWRLFLGLSVLTAAGLSAARWYYSVDELSWGTIAALSTIHVWFPLVILGPISLPYTLSTALVLLAVDWYQRRGERPEAEPGAAPDPARDIGSGSS
jgi:hypothetical protein